MDWSQVHPPAAHIQDRKSCSMEVTHLIRDSPASPKNVWKTSGLGDGPAPDDVRADTAN